jgi:hypothetical protein
MDKHLTLHLYRVQEVLASLRCSLTKHNYKETLFWALELYDSDVLSESLEMLFSLWFDLYGIPSWKLLIPLYEIQKTGELERDHFIHLIMAWSQEKTLDSTLVQLLVRGLNTPTDWVPTFPHSKTYHTKAEAINDCLQRGKLLEAWLFARSMLPEDQWSLVKKFVESTGNQSKFTALTLLSELTYGDPIQRRAAAFCVACLNEKRWTQTQVLLDPNSFALQLETVRLMQLWNENTVLRTQRIFAVRPEAITYLCQRSSLSTQTSTEEDIMETLETTLWNSPYWKEIMKEYVLELEDGFCWASSNHKEGFYDTYFTYPGDIPDEWSIADREKSHGRGLGKSELVAKRQYLCSGILRNTTTLSFWEPLVFKEDDDLPMDFSVYDTLPALCNFQFPMKPVRKEFIEAMKEVQPDIEFVKHQPLPPQDAHTLSHTDEEED